MELNNDAVNQVPEGGATAAGAAAGGGRPYHYAVGCSFMLQTEALSFTTEELDAKYLQAVSDKVITSVKESELLASGRKAGNIYDYKVKLGKETGFARTVFNKNQFYKLFTSCANFKDPETKKYHDKFAESFVFK